MHKSTYPYIRCPHCGAEYTTAEIFIPNSFVGAPEYVKRDLEGRIQSIAGSDMDLQETYTCDFCKLAFKVQATVSFETIPCSGSVDTTNSIPHVERFRLKEF